ncbi:hypothetical protein [Bianquea renquensis]|nr:hypothetical protein [Bianquea renquensis]
MTIAILCALLLAVAVLAIQSCCRRLARAICGKGGTPNSGTDS